MPMHDPVHPGFVVRDGLVELGLSVTEAASRLGVSRTALSRVLNGHAAISPALAVRLECAGFSTARLWIGMQGAYDLAQAQAQKTPNVQRLDAA